MKTLVYFASGKIKETYKNLDFDQIILIDNCFEREVARLPQPFKRRGKITCIGMDCLESIALLKEMNVKIDCFVSLNEGLWEGGGSYAINSDMFLGYVMPLLKDEYIHIMNKDYYTNQFNVTMDLPYTFTELQENNPGYIDPLIFSEYKSQIGFAKTYLMKRKAIPVRNYSINNLKLEIIHDSLWSHTSSLDLIILRFSEPFMEDFFSKQDKVMLFGETFPAKYYPSNSQSENTGQHTFRKISEILDYCVSKKVSTLGLLPLSSHHYFEFSELLKNHQSPFPETIKMFYLNKSGYQNLIQILDKM